MFYRHPFGTAVSFTERKKKNKKNAILFCFVVKGTQLSPEAVVNNGGDKRRCNERQGYLALCTDLEGVAVFAGLMP